MPEHLGTDEFVDLEEIARGGYGIVYRAQQPAFRRTVAIKVLTSVDEETRSRFVRERHALGAVSSHPNIPEVFGSGMTPAGSPYIAMAYMSGGSYEGLLAKQGPLPVGEAIRAVVKIAGAVETAHNSGILHRDIKPDNVLLSSFGEPQLADFGIAAIAGGTRTKTGSTPASLAYAAPEVLDRKKPNTLSDVYSLGATLFALVAGYPPFWRESDESLVPLMVRTAQDPLPDLRHTGVPHELCDVMERATSKRPEERYSSAASFGEALRSTQATLGLPVTEMVLQQPFAGDARQHPAPARPEAENDENGAARRQLSPAFSTQRVAPALRAPAAAPAARSAERSEAQRRRWPLLLLIGLSMIGLTSAAFWAIGAVRDGQGSESPDVTPPRRTAEPEDAAASRFVVLINDTRRERGLGELVVDPELSERARSRASQNARSGVPDTTPNLDSLELTRDYASLGENEASGPSVESVYAATLNSPKQLGNISDPTFNAIGVGIAYSSDERVLYVAEYFGHQLGTPGQP